MKVKSLSHIRLFLTAWTVAYQASPSMGVSRQEYWSGSPVPSPLIPPRYVSSLIITFLFTCSNSHSSLLLYLYPFTIIAGKTLSNALLMFNRLCLLIYLRSTNLVTRSKKRRKFFVSFFFLHIRIMASFQSIPKPIL